MQCLKPFTAFDVDYIAPIFFKVVFEEGSENGETVCSRISVVDDNDFEETIEDFIVFIQTTTISSDYTLLGEPSYTSVLINDTRGR